MNTHELQGWHILGAGAMGCLWAAAIWQMPRASGKVSELQRPPVTLLLRSADDVQAYETRGTVLLETAGELVALPIPACSTQNCADPVQQLLVATKAQDVVAALENIRHLLTPATIIVLLQNGLKVQREITRLYGAQRVYCLSTSHGAWLHQAFHVVHAGISQTWLGQIGIAGSSSVLDSNHVLERLPAASMHIGYDAHIETRLWRKLALNCAVNILSVLYDCRNGELLNIPQARQDLQRVCGEITALYAVLPGAPALQNLAGEVESLLHATAMNYSSTLQDVRRGRPTEVDHLNGYLCELARNEQLDCAVNEELMQRFRAVTTQRTGC